MCRVCSTNGEKRNACRIFVGELEGNRPLGRYKGRWEHNNKTDLAHDRDQWSALVNPATNFQVPHNVGKFLSG
jgi:hypothetical protein